MKTETKHTPGPWKAFGGIVHDSKNRAVARAGCLADLDETDANAHLIASAPELLEACKLMVGMLPFEWDGIPGQGNTAMDSLRNKVVTQARAAIRKACDL